MALRLRTNAGPSRHLAVRSQVLAAALVPPVAQAHHAALARPAAHADN